MLTEYTAGRTSILISPKYRPYAVHTAAQTSMTMLSRPGMPSTLVVRSAVRMTDSGLANMAMLNTSATSATTRVRLPSV